MSDVYPPGVSGLEPQIAGSLEPEVWAIVDLMGHKRLAGRLTEEEHFGAKLGRLDVPEGNGFATHFFGGASVYSVIIVTEAVARIAAKNNVSLSVHPWDFPKQLPAPEERPGYPDEDDLEDTEEGDPQTFDVS